MSVQTGCSHLETFKNSDLKTFRIVHAVFVVCSTKEAHKNKVRNAFCHVCNQIGPHLHACMHCVFFGCHKHIREHGSEHPFSLELGYGQIHCALCDDYVYDSDLESIATTNKFKGSTCRKRLLEWNNFNLHTREESESLANNPKRVYLTPDTKVGLRGLLNLGQTCFMNVIIQTLVHTPLLRDYFLSERHKCKSDEEHLAYCVVCELTRIFQEIYKGVHTPLALDKLLYMTWTQAPYLAGYHQHDAHEYLMATLQLLHKHCTKELSSSEMPSSHRRNADHEPECSCIIDQIFSGGSQSDVVCSKCLRVSTKIDPTLDFNLDLGSSHGSPPSTLIDCLERYTRLEYVSDLICSNCKSSQKSTKQITIKTLPIVATFHLKRFALYGNSSNPEQQKRKKITAPITFQQSLDMTPYMSRTGDIDPLPRDNRYSLFAVVNHTGKSLDSGHYTAYVRQKRDYWYKFDDEKITKTNLSDVLNSEAYLLFYHKNILDYD